MVLQFSADELFYIRANLIGQARPRDLEAVRYSSTAARSQSSSRSSQNTNTRGWFLE